MLVVKPVGSVTVIVSVVSAAPVGVRNTIVWLAAVLTVCVESVFEMLAKAAAEANCTK